MSKTPKIRIKTVKKDGCLTDKVQFPVKGSVPVNEIMDVLSRSTVKIVVTVVTDCQIVYEGCVPEGALVETVNRIADKAVEVYQKRSKLQSTGTNPQGSSYG